MRFAIKQNTPLTSCVYRMVLQGDTSAITAPGQFVQVQVPGFYLRRPISVCDWDSETLTLVYKVVGNGTDAMCRMIPGTELDLLTGLGNGFDITRCGERPLLIGGGVGLPPMVGLCRCLIQAGKHPTVLAGFNTADEVFLREDVEKLGAPFVLATMDGHQGTCDRRAAGNRLHRHLCVRAAADAQGDYERGRPSGTAVLRGAHGLRLRRVHGLHGQGQGRLQANLQGRPGAGARGGHLVSSKDLRVTLSGVTLDNPVIPASGTYGFGQEFTPYYDINILGSLSFKGTTAESRFGNPTPRIAECPNGMLNSVGLQNPGVEHVIAHELPALRKIFHKPIIANISGFSVEEYVHCVELLTKEEQVEILEINISCPNVRHGGMAFGTNPDAAAEITRAVKQVATKPVYMKLSPNVTDIVSIAKACEEAGADGLSLINTLLGMRIDLKRRRPVLANVMGGYSGPGVFPVAVRMVYQVTGAVSIPVIGMGGISSAQDVIEMMMAGAKAVQVGAANLADPYACKKIIDDLPREMERLGIECLSDIQRV